MTEIAGWELDTGLDDDDALPFDYDNPPLTPLTSFHASIVKMTADMKTNGLIFTLRVDADEKSAAMPMFDYPQQELHFAVERVDFPELEVQEPGDSDGEWGVTNYPEGGWRGPRKRDLKGEDDDG